MSAHYVFKGACKLVAGISPVTDLLQPQNGRASEFGWIEILMSDCVSPSIELLKPILTRLVSQVLVLHFVPEGKSESVVIFPNVTGIRIACLELSLLHKNVAECCSQNAGRNTLHEMVRTFRVQVATVPLKLG